jgi:3-hydroxybutyryl-CoA dehydrogenase
VLASNSSGLPLQKIADKLRHPERFLGIHYFHPARELPLVESSASPRRPTTAST